VCKALLVANWDWVLYNYRLPLARSLQKAGFQVSFICPKGQYTSRLKKLGFECINWRLDRKGWNPLKELYAVKQLIGIYRRERPDLVQHFTIKPNLYGSMAARVVRVPFVINTFSGLGLLFSDDCRFRMRRVFLTPFMSWVLRAPNIWTIFQTHSDCQTLTRIYLVILTKAIV